MNINFNQRLAALVHDIEGDQPPPLDHYRYEVSTLPDGKTCVTLYGPEGHESNALTWYQRLDAEPSFPDTWRYVVESLGEIMTPKFWRFVRDGESVFGLDGYNVTGMVWITPDNDGFVIEWSGGELLTDDEGRYAGETPSGRCRVATHLMWRNLYKSLCDKDDLVYQPTESPLDPADFDYDWRADTNLYPRIVTIKHKNLSLDQKHITIILEDEDWRDWCGWLQGKPKKSIWIYPKSDWERVD